MAIGADDEATLQLLQNAPNVRNYVHIQSPRLQRLPSADISLSFAFLGSDCGIAPRDNRLSPTHCSLNTIQRKLEDRNRILSESVSGERHDPAAMRRF